VVRRYVVTGAPGAGKTVLVEQLHARGYPVAREAATDVIAELQAQDCAQPWTRDDLCDRITALPRARRRAPVPVGAGVQFQDRSVLCTLALARYLGHRVPRSLTAEVDDVVSSRVFDPVVFLVRALGFIQPTAARRISYEDSLVFEAVHEAVYRENGFTLLEVPPASPTVRADLVER
jgi:predicted ATPase